MALVTVTINTRKYEVSCDDGQEAHLERLSAYVDTRVGEIVKAVGQVGDAQLLVMASLVIADDLSEAYAERDKIKAAGNGSAGQDKSEETLGLTIDSLAERIEHIAERLKQA